MPYSDAPLRCTTCDRLLPVEEFHRRADRPNRGRQYRCKDCSAKAQRAARGHTYRARPASPGVSTKQLHVRVPEDLHAEVSALAESRGASVSYTVNVLLSAGLRTILQRLPQGDDA